MASDLINLMNLSPKELGEFFESIGEKSFRSQQILRWIYQFGVTNFDEMTNLRKDLRAKLKAFLSSGLGYSTVGKFPSGISCSFTTFMFSNPISFKIL